VAQDFLGQSGVERSVIAEVLDGESDDGDTPALPFRSARFTGCLVNFWGARFSSGRADFGSAEFTGGTVSFRHAEFTGGTVDFGSAMGDRPPGLVVGQVVKLPAAWLPAPEGGGPPGAAS
jgi:hypothetical protein